MKWLKDLIRKTDTNKLDAENQIKFINDKIVSKLNTFYNFKFSTSGDTCSLRKFGWRYMVSVNDQGIEVKVIDDNCIIKGEKLNASYVISIIRFLSRTFSIIDFDNILFKLNLLMLNKRYRLYHNRNYI